MYVLEGIEEERYGASFHFYFAFFIYNKTIRMKYLSNHMMIYGTDHFVEIRNIDLTSLNRRCLQCIAFGKLFGFLEFRHGGYIFVCPCAHKI